MDNVKACLVQAILFLLVSGTGFYHFGLVHDQQKRQDRESLEALCTAKAEDIRVLLGQLVDAARVLSVLTSRERDAEQGKNLREHALATMSIFPAVEALCLADAGLVTRVYPARGFETLTGMELPGLAPRPRPGRERPDDLQSLSLGSLRLGHGVRAIYARAPFNSVGLSRSMAVAFMGVERLVERAGLDTLTQSGAAFLLEEAAGQGTVRLASAGWEDNLQETARTLVLSGMELTLRLGRPDQAASGMFWTAAASCGAGLAALFMARILQKGSVRLRAVSKRRTERLKCVCKRLAGEIRARKESQVELADARRLGRGIFLCNPAALLLADPSTLCVVEANEAAGLLLGRTPDDMAQTPLARLLHLDDDDVGRLAAMAMRGEGCAQPCRIDAPSGTTRHGKVHFGSLREGDKPQLLCVLQFVEAGERTPTHLGHSQHDAEALLQGLDCAFLVLDRQGSVGYASNNVTAWTGIEPSRIAGSSFLTLLAPEERAAAWKRFQNMVQGRVRGYSALQRVTRTDGASLDAAIRTCAVLDPLGRFSGAFSAIMDVTELSLRPPDPVDFPALGHDLRTPLNAAMGLAELTLHAGGLSAAQHDNLLRILDACRQALETIAAELDRSAPEPSVQGGAAEKSPPAARTAASATLREVDQRLAGRRVLVVEDDPLSRHTAARMLALGGVETVLAENGQSALRELEHGDIDLVLLDLGLQDMDGYQVLEAIRGLPGSAELPVVALTGRASGQERERSLEAGMDGHLTKPLDSARLFEELAARLLGSPRGGRSLPVLDSTRALGQLMGNHDLYRRLLASFLRDYATLGDSMAESLARGEHEALIETAHTVKGLAGSLGAPALARACQELEAALRRPEGQKHGALLAFREALDAFLERAQRHLTDSDLPII
ncbi:Signal transduction histidine-protein kinase BarA [Fundidesulfovibrio magnetotacticus]|uniref:histidine kinase n=1 Tax=Fundidesulfovibrio magnetotacticus TaxID=2730080 RepID=A0A6V8LN16_9BACT|nr:response regulator [Fundidesulfovibrio magnetotacticus]GFK94062.1 Signal transduction histidine-protein kinase BarA [Fundidesulfovibrio magnetotacticus]